jgi:hypothetical protein
MVACAELGLLIRKAVEQIRPEAESVIRLIDDLERIASELDVCDDALDEARSTAADHVAVMAFHLPNDLQAAAENLQGICELLKRAATVDGKL